jgi:hypothetical protein
VATIERALVAICQAHKLHGPRKAHEVGAVLQGIRRTLGVAPDQKDPVLVDTLRALIEPMRKDDPGDVTDRAGATSRPCKPLRTPVAALGRVTLAPARLLRPRQHAMVNPHRWEEAWMIQQAKRGPDPRGRNGSCTRVTRGCRPPRSVVALALSRALVLVGGAGLVGAGCQLVIDGDRYSFSFEAQGEIVTGNLDPGAGDASSSASDDAGTPYRAAAGDDASATHDDDPTDGRVPAPLCDGCRIESECLAAGQHRAGNDCEVCDPSRNASGWSPRDGSCDDGLYCTVDDHCTDARCSGAPRPCDDEVACNGRSSCDEQQDQCSGEQNQCPSSEICDVATDTCSLTCAGCLVEGICVPAGGERTGNPCLVCQPERSTTAYTPAPGKACGDAATECSGADTCDAAAVCQANDLPADNPCGSDARSVCAAHDACDGNGQCTLRALPDDTPCPDAAFCTSAETCQGGACQRTVTSCPSGQSCDAASDACRCDNGGCFIGGTCLAPGVADPQNVCFICSDGDYVPNDGAPCGDQREYTCSAPDQCKAGVCDPRHAPSSTPCSLRDDCSEPTTCDGNGGCPFIPAADGTSCEDASFCDGIERCEGGECRAGRPRGPDCIEP